MEVQATATNDGIVLRIPDTESEPPSAELLRVDPEELESIVTEEVGSSALFAARFREMRGPRACCCPGEIRSRVRRCGSSGCARHNC